jgi:ribosomal-protein-alanine N-acetyltransferase
MLGFFSKAERLELDILQSDIRLTLPQFEDYISWKDARGRNRANLQPFEPTWSGDALTRKIYRRFVRHAHHDLWHDGGGVFFIKLKARDEVIGGINLRNIRRGSADMGTLGYWMASEYSGAGRMKQAVGRIVDFGFRKYGLHRIEAACVPENEASARILLFNGFEEEGFAKAYLKINGRWRDHRLFAIVRPDSYGLI